MPVIQWFDLSQHLYVESLSLCDYSPINIYMKRQRRMVSGETHYSQPLTHRQRDCRGISKRYVSYSSARMSNCLGCWKEELQNKIRREDKLLIKNLDEEEFFPHFEAKRLFGHINLDGEIVYSTSLEEEEITVEPIEEEEEEWFDDIAWELHLEYLKYRREALDSVTDEELEYADWDDYSDYSPEENDEYLPEDFDWDAFETAHAAHKRAYCPPACFFMSIKAEEKPSWKEEVLSFIFMMIILSLIFLAPTLVQWLTLD